MIRHIVMWKMDERYTKGEKDAFLTEFSKQLLQLEGKLEQLKSIRVMLNSTETPSSNYDLLLDTTFESIKDLEDYSKHPEHLAVGEFSKTHRKQRSCVDFEF